MHDVEVRADGSPQAQSTPLPAPLPPDSGFVEFAVSGTDVSGEYRCADCGYGAVIRRALPPCPMCGGTIWERRAPRPAD